MCALYYLKILGFERGLFSFLGEIMFILFKRQFFGRLFLAPAIFFFFAVAVADAAVNVSPSQEVYLADEPLPKIVARLKEQGIPQDQIIKHLKDTLPKITQELAQDKFKIEWIDNGKFSAEAILRLQRGLSQQIGCNVSTDYPAVAICYMAPEVGYGLFAMEDIKCGRIIAEYTGKRIKDKRLYKENAYSAGLDVEGMSFESIDAEFNGNAARFAQHLLSEDDLSLYQYAFFTRLKDDIAKANSGLALFEDIDGRHKVLVAIEDIKAFEQIGFSYDPQYGFEQAVWPEEPYLFDKKSDIISRDEYQILLTGVMLLDQIDDKYFLIQPEAKNKLNSVFGLNPIVGNYRILKTSHSLSVVVDSRVWKEKIAKPGSRLTVPGFFIYPSTDVKKFVAMLVELDKYEFSKEDRAKILSLARDNDYTKANRLLNSLKKKIKDKAVEL